MPDDKTTKVPETAAPDTGPGKPPEQATVKEPVKTEPPTPEQKPPEQAADKATPPKDKEAPTSEKAGAEKSPNVSVYNFSEIMAEKKAAEKEKTPEKSATVPDKGKEPAKPDKKKAAPAKEPADKKKTSIWKEPADKTAGGKEKAPKAAAPKKAADKGSAAVKPPAPEQPKPQEPPKEAPRRGEEQIVYIKLDELHAFKNHPFQVRDDDEMRAMVSSVKDKGVTQPAIVRPREDGGYEIVSGHRRQKASELAGFADMPCIVRNLTDDEAITQMVEDNLNQREEILPSERAKALKMQLEAIKHQGSRTSGQIDPKDAGKRSNEIVAERNKMAVKQVQRYIRLNELVPDLMALMDAKKLGFTTAVELSYISKKNQNYIAVAIDSQQSSPSQAQAKRMRELDEKKLLNGDVIDGIMMEDKKEVDKVILTGAELSKYFGKETTPREMKDQIIKLLDDWKLPVYFKSRS